MKSKSLIFRLAFVLLSLVMFFSSSSSKPINSTVNGYYAQTISRVLLSQTQNAESQLKRRFSDYVIFFQECTGYSIRSVPTIKVKPEPGGGARYSPENGGSITFDYDSVVTIQEANTQNVDPIYLLQSEMTLAEEKAKALHELSHDRSAELYDGEAQLNQSSYDRSIEEGQAYYIGIRCMMKSDSELLHSNLWGIRIK